MESTNKVVLRFIQRELLLLLLLAAITVPVFLFTRKMAARNRDFNLKVARTWYELGQDQLNRGSTLDAIGSYRKAATNDHDNLRYTLALASGLAAIDQREEARQVLLRVRVSAPENGEVNLSLARLAAKDGSTAEAIRYYHNALYGVWPAEQMTAQRGKVRTELVHFLLSSGDAGRALSELLILSSDIPDTAAAHTDLGRLFMDAGDAIHALDQFKRALNFDSKSAPALQGAGLAAFDLADYVSARRYLESAMTNGATSDAGRSALETTRIVLEKDPLAPRLSTAERTKRLLEDLNSAGEELLACLSRSQGDRIALAVLQPLQEEIDWNVQTTLTAGRLRQDPDGFREGLNMIYRVESATGQLCGETSSTHQALLLIARRNGAGDQ